MTKMLMTMMMTTTGVMTSGTNAEASKQPHTLFIIMYYLAVQKTKNNFTSTS